MLQYWNASMLQYWNALINVVKGQRINKCLDLRKIIFYFYKAFLSRIAKPTGLKNNEVKMKKNILKSDSY